MTKRRKGGGGKLSRSETVSVRLDPKLKFAADLAARKHRRTLSSLIELAIEKITKATIIYQLVILSEGTEETTAYDVMEEVYDPEEADRLVKLADRYKNCLTHDEEVMWKLIHEKDELWTDFNKSNVANLNFKLLRNCFEDLKKFVQGDINEEGLHSKIKTAKNKIKRF